MSPSSPPSCTASAIIDFPGVADYLEPILAAIATHDMTVQPRGNGYVVTSAFGQGFLKAESGRLRVRVETADKAALNRMKHALAGPIGFIAARAKPVIAWRGDEAGWVPIDDLRVVRVARVQSLTPFMRRILFVGDDLSHLDRIDQLHCRLIFAPKGDAAPAWPMLDDQGRVAWPAGKMPTRVYTIRRIDADRGELTIDFALHAAPGPATAWALGAERGDSVAVIGPAAGGPKPARFYVFVGDETGLPGIARILEYLPKAALGVAFIEVRDRTEELPLVKPDGIALHWLHRAGAPAGATTLLADALRTMRWPDDPDGVFIWGGCEHKAFRAIHRFLKHDLGLDGSRQVLYSHWHRALSEEQIIEIGGDAYLP